MMRLGNLEVETLQAEKLKADKLTVNTINGITSEELSLLKGVKGNIQSQLTSMKNKANSLKALWS